ncbi:MAG TPA: pyridoxal-phosphate dependent enzyme [Solirubrobacteraceae bacterium]|nr:pyridoxal-phosphate dependent enzyme [Solirubrobacteraceae bacterium]
MTVTAGDVERARDAVADVVRRTPVLASATLSERFGVPVVLKAESLQRTGSFKIRGALNKVAALGERCAAGVICGSAGNHAQALAFAALQRGVPCEVFMPDAAPVAKVEGAEALGARVVRAGATLDECIAAAQARAEEAGMVFVHPFDDTDVVAGQGTLGLELLEDVPDLAKVLIPVGGGGLAAGVAIAIKSARPEVEIVGVRVDPTLTIADGIAVKRPGAVTAPLLERWVDGIVRVEEDDVAEAIVLLLERAKLVVEGAGAVGVAALVAGLTGAAASGTTAVVLSGGNVDAGLLAEVARHHETVAGRRLVISTRVADRPGSLAGLLAVVGDSGANLLEVGHVREGIELHVRETGVQLVLETRGREHAGAVLAAIAAAGYPADGYSGVT